jgi:hypothetical protein
MTQSRNKRDMRKLLLFSILLTFGMLMHSCRNVYNQLQEPNAFGFKLNNVQYNGGLYQATYAQATHTFNAQLYIIDDRHYATISFSGKSDIAPGTYPVGYDSISNVAVAMNYSTGVSAYPAYNGSLTVSSVNTVNKTISGKFNFSGKSTLPDIVQVTNGTFDNIVYISQ